MSFFDRDTKMRLTYGAGFLGIYLLLGTEGFAGAGLLLLVSIFVRQFIE